MTTATIKRERFIALEAREPHALSMGLYYVAADFVQWVKALDGGAVMVRLESGDELIVNVEPVALCARLEAMLTQRYATGDE